MRLKPFFTFYGGKHRAAKRYPAPIHDAIVEPFAGSAGYACLHHEKQVTLVEKDPKISALWRFLIRATPKDFLCLPDISEDGNVNDLGVHEEARILIGFWLNGGSATPCNTPSAWMRSGVSPTSFWGATIRQRLATQAGAISHWKIIEGDYYLASNEKATWFIDPPYQKMGRRYKYNSVDFSMLATWSQERNGQVIVCENVGALWLPFIHFGRIKGAAGKKRTGSSDEAIWLRNADHTLWFDGENAPSDEYHDPRT